MTDFSGTPFDPQTLANLKNIIEQVAKECNFVVERRPDLIGYGENVLIATGAVYALLKENGYNTTVLHALKLMSDLVVSMSKELDAKSSQPEPEILAELETSIPNDLDCECAKETD